MKFVMRLSFYDNIHIVYEHELRMTRTAFVLHFWLNF